MLKKNIWLLFLAFGCGIGSSLYVSTPFGRVAMFDLISYILGPILFIVYIRRFSRSEKRLLFLAFLWFLGTCYSNWWRKESFEVALKGNAIVFNVFCMLIVGIVAMRRSFKTFLWFAVGYGVGAVISLYVFQNGFYLYYAENAGYLGEGGMQDYLIEKQVYPLYAQAVFLSFLFPLRVHRLVPWFAVAVGCFITAFVLLFEGGSRSGFGMYFLSAILVIGYAYFRPVMRNITRNTVLFVLTSAVVVALAFMTYSQLAKNGVLGKTEYDKYMHEIEDSQSGVLGSRDDLIRAWPFLKHHPLVGCGSSAIDRWGYMEDPYDFRIPGHSALVGAWTQDGMLGLIFWCYSLYLIFEFVRKRMFLFVDWFPFLAFLMIFMSWNILFSPFGGYRGIVCVILALCIVTRSPSVQEQVVMALRPQLKNGLWIERERL